MSSIVQSFQKRSQTLPVSSSLPHHHQENYQSDPPPPPPQQGGVHLRRRLSTLYAESIEPRISASPAAAWAALRRTKSASSAAGTEAGASIRKWWGWGLSWILAGRPAFARDLELNEEETKALGAHTRGTWRHVFYKLRSELRRLVWSPDRVGLPQTCRYDSFNYAKNFDDGSVTTRLVG